MEDEEETRSRDREALVLREVRGDDRDVETECLSLDGIGDAVLGRQSGENVLPLLEALVGEGRVGRRGGEVGVRHGEAGVGGRLGHTLRAAVLADGDVPGVVHAYACPLP